MVKRKRSLQLINENKNGWAWTLMGKVIKIWDMIILLEDPTNDIDYGAEDYFWWSHEKVGFWERERGIKLEIVENG